MPCVLRSLSFSASLVARRLGGVNGIAEQHAEGALVLVVFGKVGHGGAHGLRAILNPFAKFAVGQDVQLVIEYAPQHSCTDVLLGHIQVEEVAPLLTALV